MYDKVKLYDILRNDDYKTVNEEGKIFPPSHVVYDLIADEYEQDLSQMGITPKHIYTILKNDRNGMYTAV